MQNSDNGDDLTLTSPESILHQINLCSCRGLVVVEGLAVVEFNIKYNSLVFLRI